MVIATIYVTLQVYLFKDRQEIFLCISDNFLFTNVNFVGKNYEFGILTKPNHF